MAIQTVRKPLIGGAAFAWVAAAVGGDSYDNSGSEVLLVNNRTAGALTVTIDAPGACSFGIVHDAHDVVAFSVPASQIGIFGPFPKERFNDTNGRVQITYPGGVGAGFEVMVIAPRG